jgi:hypothetical protein
VDGLWFFLDAIAPTCYVRCRMLLEGGSVGRLLEERRFARSANAHLSDDETVAKMGHPICCGLDLGHPPDLS